MREELRSDIVQALRATSDRFYRNDWHGLAGEMTTLADTVEQELDEGDRVECPTAEMNKLYLAEGSEPIELNVVTVNWQADQVVVCDDDGTMEIVTVSQCQRMKPRDY